MKDIQSSIRRKIAGSRFSGFSKLFLFGITGKDCIAAKPYSPVPDNAIAHHETDDESEAVKDTFEDIGIKINAWTASGVNYLSDFSLEEMSGETGIPTHTLIKYFRKHLKKDFREWKADIRIEKAKTLILEDDNNPSMEDIGYAVGFRDKSNFHRQFKRRTGCTPGQWKQCGGHTELIGEMDR